MSRETSKIGEQQAVVFPTSLAITALPTSNQDRAVQERPSGGRFNCAKRGSPSQSATPCFYSPYFRFVGRAENTTFWHRPSSVNSNLKEASSMPPSKPLCREQPFTQ